MCSLIGSWITVYIVKGMIPSYDKGKIDLPTSSRYHVHSPNDALRQSNAEIHANHRLPSSELLT
jgi:hypothetical protein